ncbi:hypothetical protein [Chenggangzhangella methanolivorans]|uniref:Uncharacterized protein n=1 Tax=Chenggangzhangella methanolivorans TaxID=1437009 RepID=A0A9E6R6B3_9HYPH|nr:hypothetical protein [Chenggangzhangella methanolivorans]QZN99050.1 hypothetical protein K6K41_19615 [Chenggangzhangella methanolivorans]
MLRSSKYLTVSLLFILAAGAGLALYLRGDNPKPVAEQPPPRPTVLTLQCQFYVFVESRPFVAFLLEKAPDDPALYRQLYVAKADGDRTDYNALVDKRPEWRLGGAGDPTLLEAQVTVPDPGPAGVAEQEIAIELREFDAARSDGVWREASLKSVYYQNLPGKCRQAATPFPGQPGSGQPASGQRAAG